MASGKSAEISYAQAVKGAEDSVNSAWINYQNSSLNRANVQNQVEIANQFLRIAQLEMRRGKGNIHNNVNHAPNFCIIRIMICYTHITITRRP